MELRKLEEVRIGRLVTLDLTERKLKVLDKSAGRIKVKYLDDETISYCAPGTLVRVGGSKR